MGSSNRGSRPAKRSGRRPGPSGTRAAILDAARRQFAAGGYDRTSLRAVAAEAQVDPGLIAHFFGSKMNLFMAVVELPVDPKEVVPRLVDGPRSEFGERVAWMIVTLLEDRQARGKVLGLLRAATSEPQAASMLREFLIRQIWGPMADRLGVEDADLRVNLAASQIVGLVMVRYVLEAEPLASLPPAGLVAVIAPSLQRYLVEPLDQSTATR